MLTTPQMDAPLHAGRPARNGDYVGDTGRPTDRQCHARGVAGVRRTRSNRRTRDDCRRAGCCVTDSAISTSSTSQRNEIGVERQYRWVRLGTQSRGQVSDI